MEGLVLGISLKVHVDLHCLSMYYHRDRQHSVDPIPEKRPADQREKPPCQLPLYVLYEITLAETDCFSKDIIVLTRK